MRNCPGISIRVRVCIYPHTSICWTNGIFSVLFSFLPLIMHFSHLTSDGSYVLCILHYALICKRTHQFGNSLMTIYKKKNFFHASVSNGTETVSQYLPLRNNHTKWWQKFWQPSAKKIFCHLRKNIDEIFLQTKRLSKHQWTNSNKIVKM